MYDITVTVSDLDALKDRLSDELESSAKLLENEIVKHEFSISPNPVNDHAVLSLNPAFSGSIEISIYNTSGVCLKSWQYYNDKSGQNEFHISLKEIPAGMYFLQVKSGNEMKTKKIVKVK